MLNIMLMRKLVPHFVWHDYYITGKDCYKGNVKNVYKSTDYNF